MGMNGTMMLLKSMGIDPAEVMQSVEAFKLMATEMSQRQTRIETKLDEIIVALDRGTDNEAELTDAIVHGHRMEGIHDGDVEIIHKFPPHRTGPVTIATFDDSQITSDQLE